MAKHGDLFFFFFAGNGCRSFVYIGGGKVIELYLILVGKKNGRKSFFYLYADFLNDVASYL